MPRPFHPAASRLFSAVVLALAGMAASPPPAVAYDIGAVIDSVRLSRYPLREPERRAWGTENVKDAVRDAWDRATKVFERIVKEFPSSNEASQARKYAGRSEAMGG